MKKQFLALASVVGLAAFVFANEGQPGQLDAPGYVDGQSDVAKLATAVFCEEYQDGRLVEFVCVGGFADQFANVIVPVILPNEPIGITAPLVY